MGDPGTADSDYNYDFDGGSFNPITRANHAGTNWFNEIMDNAPLQSYNLSASGGGENGQYAISAGYFSQEGTVIQTKYDRYTLRANTLFRVKDRVRIGQTFTLSYSERVSVPGGSQTTGGALMQALRMPGIVPVFDIRGNYAGTNGGELSNASNPVAMLDRNKDNLERRIRTLGSA